MLYFLQRCFCVLLEFLTKRFRGKISKFFRLNGLTYIHNNKYDASGKNVFLRHFGYRQIDLQKIQYRAFEYGETGKSRAFNFLIL